MAYGLTPRQAVVRLEQFGLNQVGDQHHIPGVRAFLLRFKNPLIIILLVAALASALLGEVLTFVIIAVIVFLSVLLDFINTFRSEKAARQLNEHVRVKAVVIRGGRQDFIPISHLVPGDVVILTAGKIVPADGKLLDGKDVYVNEAALSGESFPQTKTNGSALYMGSSVTSGEGRMLVQQTGAQTKFAHIAAALQRTPETEFDRELHQFSLLILRITAVLVVMIFIFNLLFRHNVLGSLLFSLALAVGLTPSLLPPIK